MKKGFTLVEILVCVALVSIVGGLIFGGCRLGCQSRTISRITGKALKLELPSDFSEPVSFSSGREGEKDLFYKDTTGNYRVKTYSDFGILEASIVFVKKE